MILAVCPNPSVDTLVEIAAFNASDVNRALSEKRYPGGKGVHVALAAAEYHESVRLLAYWGGPTGDWIKEQCEAQGIECMGPRLIEWNRFCITFSQDGPFNETELLGIGPAIEQTHLDQFYEAFESNLIGVSVVVMSGSLPPQCPSDLYNNLIKIAHTYNIPALIDTTGDALEQALPAKPYGVHLNKTETQQVKGVTNIEGAMDYLDTFSTLKIITHGEDGLYLGFDNELLHANVGLGDIHSTIGSGDCLMAGIAVALDKKFHQQELARMGVAFGAANCLRKDLGMLYKHDVDSLLPQVIIKKLTTTDG